MVRALRRLSNGAYQYRSGPDKGRFAKKADIEAFRAVQAANGRKGAAKTNANAVRYRKAAQTINEQRGIPVSTARQRIRSYLEDYYDAQAAEEDLPDFAVVYSG